MAVIFVILAFAAISAVGDIQAAQSDEAPNGQQPAESVEYEVGDDDDDSVTMAIEMDEGGTIDLEMARGAVVVDTWEGKEVLVIVEKKQGKTPQKCDATEARPAAFKVTRQGNKVRIAALDRLGHHLTNLDLSYRVMVPKDRNIRKSETHYDLSKLSAVIFKALHREAINWLMR